jgi:ADP-ribosylglycohydrolase
LSHHLTRAFVAWYLSPENNRAAGMTCMTACRNLHEGWAWQEATRTGSKGCGANMRVMPVGVLDTDDKTRATVAQFQAAHTHGHPTALAASDLTAHLIAALGNGLQPQDVLQEVHNYAENQRTVYHAEWLGGLWEDTFLYHRPEDFIAHGWEEMLVSLVRVEVGLANPETITDPCLITGEGWIAEQALATALLCFLLQPDHPVQTIQRAATTGGDSDSIACIAGALAGAYHGLSAWPKDWRERVEYRDQLLDLAKVL